MIVIQRNGQTTVIAGWRARLISAGLFVGITLLMAIVAFVFIGVAVAVAAVLMIVVPVAVGVAILASLFRSAGTEANSPRWKKGQRHKG